jgi:hypothetical protein
VGSDWEAVDGVVGVCWGAVVVEEDFLRLGGGRGAGLDCVCLRFRVGLVGRRRVEVGREGLFGDGGESESESEERERRRMGRCGEC